MADRRYGTAAWKRTRRVVLQRDGHTCQVGAPGCTIRATTVHHILPSSQHPELFFQLDNLQAACRACNSHGQLVRSDNRANRQTIAHLEAIVEQQQDEIDELRRQLEQNAEPAPRCRLTPRIL